MLLLMYVVTHLTWVYAVHDELGWFMNVTHVGQDRESEELKDFLVWV